MATLTGNARTFLNAPAGAIPIRITTLGKSVVVSSRVIITGNQKIFSAPDGSFSMTLAAGDYLVDFNGNDKFQIAVPNNDSTMAFLDCVTSNITQPSPSVPGSSWPSFPDGSDWIVTSDGRLIGRSRTPPHLYHRCYLVGSQNEGQMIIEPGTETP